LSSKRWNFVRIFHIVLILKEVVTIQGRKSKARKGNGGDATERAADVKPIVEVLLTGYRRHGLDPREAALELSWRIATVAAARQAFFAQRLQSFGLPRVTAQYGVLRDIYFSDDHCLSQAQIMRIHGVSSANVTRLIHGLEQAGLVRRDVNPEDKRSTLVHLTEAGLTSCETTVPAIGQDLSDLGNCYSDAELAMLNELLARLHMHIENMASHMSEVDTEQPD
jgi:DNA-binding MarR family transcriptional regulator